MKENACKLTIVTDSGSYAKVVTKGTNLHKALLQDTDSYALLRYQCGGKGTCGKCRLFLKGEASDFTPAEIAKLTPKELASGIRLACQVDINDDIEVIISDTQNAGFIQVEGLGRRVELSPLVKRVKVCLPQASVQDGRDDAKRLTDALGCPNLKIRNSTLRKISESCNGGEQDLWVTLLDSEIIDISLNDTESEYGFAVDIGSTTLVGYLVNMKTGEVESTISQMNAQNAFGADVISRVSYCIENPEGRNQMQKSITDQLDDMLKSLLEKRNIPKEAISGMAFSGNTIMLHFLMGLKADRIAASPFTPVNTASYLGMACELGLKYHPNCAVYLLPCISGYIGADIVAGILACDLAGNNTIQMLVDIGTNGEMALSCSGNIQCCSVAAGPAFEGAQIRCGVGGIKGAIDEVTYRNGRLITHTLWGGKPVGLCGSGLVDLMAVLLELGIIGESGHFEDYSTWHKDAAPLKGRMQDYNGEEVFVIAYPEETASGFPIYLCAQDIREVQLAKAAVYAGIKTLINHQGITMEDIDVLWLAGGFGNRLKKDSAITIGLLPKELSEKIRYAGNTSGSGCIMALLSSQMRKECDRIREEANYLELSGLPFFSNEFIEAMAFGSD